MTTIGTIGIIRRYPVKSLLGEQLGECSITPCGLDGDRTHALLDASTGKIASAKQPDLWRDLLLYSASAGASGDFSSITVIDPAGNQVAPFATDFDAKLSGLLGRKVRLVNVRPAGIELNRARPDEVMAHGVDAKVTQDVLAIAGAAPAGGFFDFAPVHLITQASLDAVRSAAPDAPIGAERYRPNIVIESSTSAFAENDWVGRRIRIGASACLEVIAPTPRCAVPMLIHGTTPFCREAVGVVNRLNKVEFALLGPGTFPCLGAYATVIAPGPIRRGDSVVLE
jgi:hypothetical protein